MRSSPGYSIVLPKEGVGAPVYLIDGTSFLYRAHFAVKEHLSTSWGLPTKAVFVFTRMMLKILKEFKPKYLVLCFDEKAPTFRHEVYEHYKANRAPMPEELVVQVPYAREVAEAMGIRIVSVAGYEADDLIATVATKVENPVVVIAGDRDLFSIVSPRVYLWDPIRNRTVTPEFIQKEYGVPPEKFPDLRALAGDPSDNIPGVKGIGTKTAARLIKEFGSVEALYENLTRVTPARLRKLLESARESVFTSKELLKLKTDAPIPHDLKFYELQSPDYGRLRSLFKKLEFRSLFLELPAKEEVPEERIEVLKEGTLKLKGGERISVFLLREEGLFGAEVFVGVFDGGKAYGAASSLVKDEVKGTLTEDSFRTKVFFDLKNAYHLLGGGFKENLFDAKLAAWLIDPVRKSYEIETLAEEHLGIRLRRRHEAGAAERAYALFRLVDELLPLIKEYGLERVLFEIEIPLAKVLYSMEKTGVLVDLKYLSELKASLKRQLAQIEEEIYGLAGQRFNLRSGRELGKILFEKLGLPKIKKTPKGTGYSTDTEVLSELALLHPLPERVLRYRTLYKLYSTYVEPIPQLINSETGRIHTTFHQTGTSTGRLSSSDPNLQNIPVKGEEGKMIRRAFVAPEGSLLLCADYSQIELRLLAHFSGDEALKRAFREGRDIHAAAASEIFGVPQEAVTPEMRRLAKVINFGIAYGMSAFGLSKELKIDVKQASAFIERYFERYPGVREYMRRAVEEAREKGFVTTFFGRRRPIPDIRSREKAVREFAERTAINTPIQGSAADIVKKAMISIHERFEREGHRAKLILQVHDELVFEVPEEEAKEVEEIVRKEMEEVVELEVPLKVNIAVGKNWAEAKG